MKDSLRKLLVEAGVSPESMPDSAMSEVLSFACAMHNRIVEKQRHLNSTYDGNEAVRNWVEDYSKEQLYELLLAIGKNVTELAKNVKDGVVSTTSSSDIANLALIVDTNLRGNFGS